MLPLILTTTAKNSSTRQCIRRSTKVVPSAKNSSTNNSSTNNSSTNNSSTNNSSTRQCTRRSTKAVPFSVVFRSTLVSFLSGCHMTLRGLRLLTGSLLHLASLL